MAARTIHPGAVPVCAGCTCLCHDLDPLAATPDFRSCELAGRFFRRPCIGNSTWNDTASERIALAGKRLREAVHFGRSIALVGLEHLAWDEQKAALSLAEALGAWVVRESEFHGNSSPWAAAFAQKGCTVASWGEIRLRSDAIVLWYAPLWHTHPRWIERFGPLSKRAHRLAVCAPETPIPANGWIEDQIVPVDPAQAHEFLRAVRASLKDESQESPDSCVRRLVHTVRNARWLAIVRGDDPPGLSDRFGVAESLTDLIADANSTGVRRVVSTHVPTEINAAGLDAVLSIRAGISTPMRFTSVGPVRAVGEWSPEKADFVVSFMTGSNEKDMPAGIRFDAVGMPENRPANCDSGQVLAIPAGTCGLESSGTLIRGDGVAVPVRNLRKRTDPDLLTILRLLRTAIRTGADSETAATGEPLARFDAEAAR